MSNIVPFEDINKMATILGKNRLFGKTADELLPLMLIAQAEGLHPATAAQEYDIIQGKPALNSRAALSRFQRAGGSIQWLNRSDQECSAEFSHPQGNKLVVTWDMKRANQAGLTGKPTWKQYPTAMLSARVVAEGVRAVYPACLGGMYTTEEVADFTDPHRNTPRDVERVSVAPEGQDEAIPAEYVDLDAQADAKVNDWVPKCSFLTSAQLKTFEAKCRDHGLDPQEIDEAAFDLGLTTAKEVADFLKMRTQ